MAYGIKIARSKTWVAKGSRDNDLRFTEDTAQAQTYTSADHANRLAHMLSAGNRYNLVAAKIPESKAAARDRAMMPRRNPSKKHAHPRMIARDGKTWVIRSVSRGRKTPGWHDVDPLTVPFLERESVRRHHGDLENRKGGRLASDERAHRWESFQERRGTRRNPTRKNPPIPWREVEKKISATTEAVTTLIWTRAWREATSTYYIVYKPSTAQSWGKVAVISSQEDVPSGFAIARPAIVARERADITKQVRSIMGKLPIAPTAEDYTG